MSKTVLITGTSSGIGKAAVEVFARAGWEVIATMRNPAKSELFGWSTNVEVMTLDVTDAESIRQVFTRIYEMYGRLDVVVNNAGYGVDGVFEAMDDEVIERQFDTNVFGLMRVTREAIRHMRPQGSGTIIQIASMGGRLAFPLYSIYHATKWAVEGFTESLQYELRPLGIRVKIIEPGVIRTDFQGEGRVHVQPGHLEDYRDFTDKVTRISLESGEKGVSPEVVARTILKAANDTGSKLRYATGMPAPILLFLKRVLPERWFYSLIRKSFKL